MSRPRSIVIIPCYNEAKRFDERAFARALEKQPETGFILVDDGSQDETLQALERVRALDPGRVSVGVLPTNQGKAEAVRHGVHLAVEQMPTFFGYWDADLATPLDAIPQLIRPLDADERLDIVLGSRVAKLGNHIERSVVRHYAGRVFATMASLALGLAVYDTQCGAKILRCTPTVRRIFREPFTSKWAFDVEVLARYLAEGGTPDALLELPLEQWTDVQGSKVRPGDFLIAIGELARIRRRYRRRG